VLWTCSIDDPARLRRPGRKLCLLDVDACGLHRVGQQPQAEIRGAVFFLDQHVFDGVDFNVIAVGRQRGLERLRDCVRDRVLTGVIGNIDADLECLRTAGREFENDDAIGFGAFAELHSPLV
jgi:hypothetical protein